jgi:hypothetical protein
MKIRDKSNFPKNKNLFDSVLSKRQIFSPYKVKCSDDSRLRLVKSDRLLSSNIIMIIMEKFNCKFFEKRTAYCYLIVAIITYYLLGYVDLANSGDSFLISLLVFGITFLIQYKFFKG